MDERELLEHIALALGARGDDPGKLPYYMQSVEEETIPEWRLTIYRFAIVSPNKKRLDYRRIESVCIEVLGLGRIQRIREHATLLSWRARGLDRADLKIFEKDRKHQRIWLGVTAISNIVLLLLPISFAVENPSWVDVGSNGFWAVVTVGVLSLVVLYVLWWRDALFPKTGTGRDPYLILTVGRAIFRGADPKVILNLNGSVNHSALLEALGRTRKPTLG